MARFRHDESYRPRDRTNFSLYVHIAPNNKLYFGITSQFVESRWQHDGVGYKTQQLFWRAIQKYGWDNFQHIVLVDNLSKEWACKLEQDLIYKYKTNNVKYGYNNTMGGDGTFGYCMTSEQIEKIRQASLGRVHTEESKRKMSEKAKGRKLSEEHRKKLSDSHKGNLGYWTGKNLPYEMKQKISKSMIGKSGSHNKPHTEETRKKISDSCKGRTVSQATKDKLRQKSLEYWKRKKEKQQEEIKNAI